MQKTPNLSALARLSRLEPPVGKIRVVIDTDAFNEVDDQFALAYALRSPEKLEVDSIYAAPFHNHRSAGPRDGMEQSYNEILNVLELLDLSGATPVCRGSAGFLKDGKTPQYSEAAQDLVDRAMSSDDEPLYVVAIGAITNIASAILMEPGIVDRIVLVWLGGHARFWHHTHEFNLKQDVSAARVVLDCGVPLIRVPCDGVTTHLSTTVHELEHYLEGKSRIGTYLTDIVRGYASEPYGWSKVIWDLAAVAWLINPEWVPSALVHSPIITDQGTWSFDSGRHFIRSATFVRRDPIFADVFRKLSCPTAQRTDDSVIERGNDEPTAQHTLPDDG